MASIFNMFANKKPNTQQISDRITNHKRKLYVNFDDFFNSDFSTFKDFVFDFNRNELRLSYETQA